MGTSRAPSWPQLAVLLILLAGGVNTAAVPLEAYGRLPSVQMMRISPDGDRVAYRSTTENGDAIIVYSVTAAKPVAAIELSEQIKPNRMHFVTPDKLVIVVSEHTRVSGFRGKFNLSQAYVLDVETKDLENLLRPGGVVYTGQTGLGRVVGLSAEKGEIYMPAFSGKAGYGANPNYSLFRIELDSPTHPRVTEVGDGDTTDYFVDSAGEVLVQEVYNNEDNRHQILVRDKDDWRVIYEHTTDVREINPVGLTQDYQYLIVSQFSEQTGYKSFVKMSLKDGEFAESIFSRVDADVEQVYTDINRVVHGVRYSGFNPSYEFLNPDLDGRMAEIISAVGSNSVWLDDWTPDWQSLIVRVEGSEFSGQYYRFTKGQKPTLLASSRPDIHSGDIHPIATFAYKAQDGLRIPALLTIPRDRLESMQNLPAVMLPHGGPESYDNVGFDWLAQALADQGYLVIQPQFRGSSGFGLAHINAGKGEWGRKMQSDLTDGIKALEKKGMIDPDRVCIVGWSYGGYAALAGGAFTPELYQCLVSIAGVSDLDAMLDSTVYEHGQDHWLLSYWRESIANGDTDDELLEKLSPANAASEFQAPVLLIHGEDDEVVPVEQSQLMRRLLRRADKPVKLMIMEDGNHSLQASANRQKALKATVEFVNRHLRGEGDRAGTN